MKGIGLIDEVSFDEARRKLENVVKEFPAGSGEQSFARRALLFLEGDRGYGLLRDLSRINDAMLRLRPESSEYKDLEWEQRRAVVAINRDQLSLVDQVINFFEEVF